ncbi:conserved Plasmodium protein, unknown function [Plasmodium malariae]|uniref:Uncharacterized protein n=1 Tax=Plasmodium malariae TaxID=5858 RepID=A0A1C3KBP8_PLAMA|nr:conserved Plasmodium protein, unknown function [Plasmodium malariae]
MSDEKTPESTRLHAFKLGNLKKQAKVKWGKKKKDNEKKNAATSDSSSDTNNKKSTSFFSFRKFKLFSRSKKKNSSKMERNSIKEEEVLEEVKEKFRFLKGKKKNNLGLSLPSHTSSKEENLTSKKIPNSDLKEKGQYGKMNTIHNASNGKLVDSNDKGDDSYGKSVDLKKTEDEGVSNLNKSGTKLKNEINDTNNDNMNNNNVQLHSKNSITSLSKITEKEENNNTYIESTKVKNLNEKKQSKVENIVKAPVAHKSSKHMNDIILNNKEGHNNEYKKQNSIETKKDGNENDDSSILVAFDNNGKSKFSKIFEKFNMLSKLSTAIKPEKKNEKTSEQMKSINSLKSNIKMSRKNSNSDVEHNSSSPSDKYRECNSNMVTVTSDDIKMRKNNLIERANLIAKRQKGTPNELVNLYNNSENIHRQDTKETMNAQVTFNVDPPLLFCENAFAICLLSNIEDLIDMIHSSSNVLRLTLDALNGNEDSVVSRLNKNTSLQKEYLMEANEIVKAVNENVQ